MTTQPTGRRRRSDAEENMRGILAAGRRELSRDPAASLAQVATAAGVSRQTLHAHFRTREALLGALLDEALAEAEAAYERALTAEDGLPCEQQLARLVEASWTTLAPYRGLLGAVLREVGSEEHRRRHATLAEHVQAVVRAGQRGGAFDRSRPTGWLVAAVFALVHAAAAEVEAGALDAARAQEVLTDTVLRALRPANG